jgi:hypothetical protein
MKKFVLYLIPAFGALLSVAVAVETIAYTNYIRQTQMPAGVTWDASDTVAVSGVKLSALAINPGGARFDLTTIKSSSVSGLTEYLLDTSYVGSYVPTAQVVVNSADPYGRDLTVTGPVPKNLPAMIRRTRADEPFQVHVTTLGLLSGATDPEPSKSVKLLRHVQSYGVGGTGVNLNRTQATLLSQASITTNGVQTLSYTLTSIPGADRSKVRGEERFSVFSLEDYQAPESQLASQFIQVWPVADGSISGLAANQLIRFAMPTVTLTLNDLYPDSRTYAQVYKGNPVLGTVGTVVPGSNQIISDSVPQNRVLTLSNYDSALSSDGRWTMELLTVTPFGIDRLAYVSFDLDRTIEVNGTFTTIE